MTYFIHPGFVICYFNPDSGILQFYCTVNTQVIWTSDLQAAIVFSKAEAEGVFKGLGLDLLQGDDGINHHHVYSYKYCEILRKIGHVMLS